MLDKNTICRIATPETIAAALRALSIPESAPLVLAAREAFCGDEQAAQTLERVAKASPACGCKGAAVKSLKALVFDGSPSSSAPFAAFSRVIPGGQSGLGQTTRTPPTHSSLDYNCRRDNGRLTECEAQILAEEGTVDVAFGTQIGSPGELRPVSGGALAKWNLGPPPPGFTWYLGLQSPGLVSGDKISQELCLNGWSIQDTDGNTPEAIRVQLATERLSLANGGGEGIQSLTGWKIIPRTGYTIKDGRCRCVSIICLRITWTGRSVVAFLLPTLDVGVNYLVAVEWLRTAIQIEAGPCPPELYCRPRPVLPEPCTCATWIDPDPQAPPAPDPDPGAAAAPEPGALEARLDRLEREIGVGP